MKFKRISIAFPDGFAILVNEGLQNGRDALRAGKNHYKVLERQFFMIDTHVHTEFSADSSAPVRGQIEQAIRLGMPRICITDHHDPDTSFTDLDFTLDLESYFSSLQSIREEYQGRIDVLIGIELGLQQHISGLLKSIAHSYPFDYIIGSSHFIDGMDPYEPSFYAGRTEEEAFRRYFEVTLESV